MSYYRSCPHCGANLDPGETCDCQRIKAEIDQKRKSRKRKITIVISNNMPKACNQ